LKYWERTFLRGDAVWLTSTSEYPIDMHAVAHAIITLCVFRDELPDAVNKADRLAAWALREMRDESGFFYYQKQRAFVNRIPYMRWTQAWMLRALSELATMNVMQERKESA
jgi:hypothetical protein